MWCGDWRPRSLRRSCRGSRRCTPRNLIEERCGSKIWVVTTVNLEDVQQDPKTILARALAGETFIVLEADRPVVEIRPVGTHRSAQRPFGLCAGEFIVPDSFDDPLSDSVI